MFLRRLELENIRSIKSLDLDFRIMDEDGNPVAKQPRGTSRPWTLLLGQNGVGKSTVLRSAALLFAGSDSLPELLSGPNRWVRSGKKRGCIRADLITAEGEERHIELTIRSDASVREVFMENTEALDALDSALSHSQRSWFTVGYGASRRLSPASTTSGPSPYTTPRAQSVQTLFNADATLNPLDSWAIDLDYRKQEEGLNQVREAISSLLPGIRFHSIDRERREIIFETEDGLLPLGQLSDGFQNMAAWCGDLLYRISNVFKDHRKPLESRGLLLIDEVDLHLHPRWQRKLREFLTSKMPNMQVLATTHSPLTAHQCGVGELYFLRREEANTPPVLKAFLGAPDRLYAHQILASPAFEIETLDSREVEQMREEHRDLAQKAKKSAQEKKRQTELEDKLTTLEPAKYPGSLDSKKTELLDEILKTLKK